MDNKDLKYLKKHYGEKFAHLCRGLFPTILEHEGLLASIISEHFAASRSLYDDILPVQDDFKSYIYSFVDVENEYKEVVNKTPEELLDEAGYVLYPECQTEEDIQSFKKYWVQREELCTFRGGRLDDCRVWFAVKKNVDEIRREDFQNPQRQDEYGTSAISIQFSKGQNSTLSIKNRYNHTVNNPDSTFGNNLDNIIPGLTDAFVKTFQIENLIDDEEYFDLENYRMGEDGKFYRVNLEIDNKNYCENNIILDNGRVVEYDKARYIIADNYIIDKQQNVVRRYDQKDDEKDSFVESLGEIKSITTKTDENGNKVVVFTPKDGGLVELTLSRSNAIIGYKNPNVTVIGDYFLCEARHLEKIELPKVKTIGSQSVMHMDSLKEFNVPNLEYMGDYCLFDVPRLKEIKFPNLKVMDHSCLHKANILEEFQAPNLETMKYDSLSIVDALKVLNVPKLKTIGGFCLQDADSLIKFSAPSLEVMDRLCLKNVEALQEFDTPYLKVMQYGNFMYADSLKTINVPALEYMGISCLYHAKSLTKFYAPNLRNMDTSCFMSANGLMEFDAPKLESMGFDCLTNVNGLVKFNAPKLDEKTKNVILDKIKDNQAELEC